MIKLTISCDKCIYEKMCKNKGMAKHAMEKIKELTYGDGPNDDYSWEKMMESYNVDISFSCPDYISSDNIYYSARK